MTDSASQSGPAAYECCQLCPRRCRVNRTAGQRGLCGETAVCRIADAGPHFGEEPMLSGTRGSGALFFSGCASRCFFCQNHQISTGGEGRAITAEALRHAALVLIGQGVHNLNFVTPDHYWPHVAALCGQLRAQGQTVPFLFNGSGYHDPACVPAYAEHIDIFLPDFKFADPDLAEYCMGDRQYPRLALAALQNMVQLKGFLSPFDSTGQETARQGVLVRHLVLPGHVDNSLQTLEILHREFGPSLPLAVMSQYCPPPASRGRGTFMRRLTADEYLRVTDRVGELGFGDVLVQPDQGDPDYLPDFTADQPFAGNRKITHSSPDEL